ncbi:MAG: hypothetical protein ACO3L6_08735, partial [Dehalococcoidia bacterium]
RGEELVITFLVTSHCALTFEKRLSWQDQFNFVTLGLKVRVHKNPVTHRGLDRFDFEIGIVSYSCESADCSVIDITTMDIIRYTVDPPNPTGDKPVV